jgi:hypothetical protein
MKNVILTCLAFSTGTAWAQTVDSAKVKPVNVPTVVQSTTVVGSINKLQEPVRCCFTQPAAPVAGQRVPSFNSPTQSRVRSTPIYENGRITGGSTSFEIGKGKN